MLRFSVETLLQVLAQAEATPGAQGASNTFTLRVVMSVGAAALAFLLVLLLLQRGWTRSKERERAAREEAEQLAREEAEQLAREERERLAAERREAEQAQLEAEQAQLGAEAEQAQLEAEQAQQIEAQRQAQLAAEQAQLAAEREAQAEAERKAQFEAERQAQLAAERQAQAEAERQAQAEAEREARAEAERKAQFEAERQAQIEAERQAQAEAGEPRPAEEKQRHDAWRAQILGTPEPAAPPPLPIPGTEAKAADPAPDLATDEPLATMQDIDAAAVRGDARLLVAEDSVTMRKVIELVLASEPYVLSIVGSGKEAIARASEVQPDLVIADVSLPDEDGYAVCRAIRADPALARTAVMLMHGSSVSFDEGEASSAGAVANISKPFSSDDLLQKISQILGREAPATGQAQGTASAPARPAAPAAKPPPAPPPPAKGPTPAPAAAQKPAAVAAAPKPRPSPGEVKKVLLVEDSVTMRKVVEMVLAGAPVALTTVATGTEAVATAKTIAADLVIADLSLDDKDGYQVCDEIRGDGVIGDVPVLLLHGSASTYDAKRAEAVRATDNLAKPFASDELLQKVEKLTA